MKGKGPTYVRCLHSCDKDPRAQAVGLAVPANSRSAPACVLHDLLERMHPQKLLEIRELLSKHRSMLDGLDPEGEAGDIASFVKKAAGLKFMKEAAEVLKNWREKNDVSRPDQVRASYCHKHKKNCYPFDMAYLGELF